MTKFETLFEEYDKKYTTPKTYKLIFECGGEEVVIELDEAKKVKKGTKKCKLKPCKKKMLKEDENGQVDMEVPGKDFDITPEEKADVDTLEIGNMFKLYDDEGEEVGYATVIDVDEEDKDVILIKFQVEEPEGFEDEEEDEEESEDDEQIGDTEDESEEDEESEDEEDEIKEGVDSGSESLEDLYRQDPVAACKEAIKRTKGESIKTRMETINTLIGGYGVEGIRGEWQNGYWGDVVATYVNMGDTYDNTVMMVRGDSFSPAKIFVSTYGDWVEKYGDKFGVI